MAKPFRLWNSKINTSTEDNVIFDWFGLTRPGTWIYNSEGWYKIQNVTDDELRQVQDIIKTNKEPGRAEKAMF